LYSEWEDIRLLAGENLNCEPDPSKDPIWIGSISRGFDIDEGWDVDQRQNKQTLDEFVALGKCVKPTDADICSLNPIKDQLCQYLEIERIADMFLFWVYADDPDYDFFTDSTDSRIASRALALSNFSNGISWTWNSVPLTATGFANWIAQVAEERASS
jgi:hypothetical protein